MEEKGTTPSDVDLHLRVRGGGEDVGRRLLAFLVDGENAQAKLIGEMLAEASKYGTVVVRRVYGDWSSPQVSQWRDVLAEHALVPSQQFPNVTGKNAIDIALIVEAMDLLHGGVVKGVCLVSSDSDYTRLATRIRESGHFVMGIGDEKTARGLQKACDVFVWTQNLGPIEPPKQARKGEAVKLKPQERPAPTAALPLLEKAFENVVGDDGLALMASLGANLRQLDPGFDPRTYGKSKLVDLIDALPDHFEIEQREALGPGAVYVKRRKT